MAKRNFQFIQVSKISLKTESGKNCTLRVLGVGCGFPSEVAWFHPDDGYRKALWAYEAAFLLF
jgi:hypothetical protein